MTYVSSQQAHQKVHDLLCLQQLKDLDKGNKIGILECIGAFVGSIVVALVLAFGAFGIGAMGAIAVAFISGAMLDVVSIGGTIFQIVGVVGFFASLAYLIYSHQNDKKNEANTVASFKNQLWDSTLIDFNKPFNDIIEDATNQYSHLKAEIKKDEALLSKLLEDIESNNFQFENDVKSWIFDVVETINQNKEAEQKEREKAKKHRSLLKNNVIDSKGAKIEIEEQV